MVLVELQAVGKEHLVAVVAAVEEGNRFPVQYLFLEEVEEGALDVARLLLRMYSFQVYYFCPFPPLYHY